MINWKVFFDNSSTRDALTEFAYGASHQSAFKNIQYPKECAQQIKVIKRLTRLHGVTQIRIKAQQAIRRETSPGKQRKSSLENVLERLAKDLDDLKQGLWRSKSINLSFTGGIKKATPELNKLIDDIDSDRSKLIQKINKALRKLA